MSQTSCAAYEYYSHFDRKCLACQDVCDPTNSYKYDPSVCKKECIVYNMEKDKLEPLKNEIRTLQMQQNVILILLILLLGITVLHYTWKLMKWLKQKRCMLQLLKKLRLKKEPQPPVMANGKDINATTIQNICAMQDIERAPSQIYSVTGAEGSVMTMTTPVSTRCPAENTTPTTEYSYDNQALAVTPISEKPNSTAVF